jgi:hypothetical protein
MSIDERNRCASMRYEALNESSPLAWRIITAGSSVEKLYEGLVRATDATRL